MAVKYEYNAYIIIPTTDNYLKTYEIYGDTLPSVPGLAIALGVSKEAILQWAEDEDKSEFAKRIDQLQCIAEKQIINLGLTGKWSPVLSKLLLGQYGHSDKATKEVKVDQTTSVRIAEDMDPKEASRLYAEMLKGARLQ